MRTIRIVVVSILLSWMPFMPANNVRAETPTDEELKALEQQIEQQEAQQKAAAEAEAKKRDEAERRRLEEEAKKAALDKQRAAEEEVRRMTEEMEKQRLLADEERKRKEDDAKRLAEEEKVAMAEQQKQRRMEESRGERQKRSARTQDSLGYVDDLVAQDLMQLEQKQKQINVSAKIDKWQSSGVLIKKGDTYKITASGQWHLGGLCNSTGPDGEGLYSVACWDLGGQTVAGYSHSALIGKIGTRNPAFFIGKEYQFTSEEEGVLYFMANDVPAFFFDNTGSLAITISGE